MTPPKLKYGQPVEVEWVDSAGTHGWMNEDDFRQDAAGAVIKSVGYFMGEKEGCAMIVADRQKNEGYVARINRGIAIPVGCIRVVRRLT